MSNNKILFTTVLAIHFVAMVSCEPSAASCDPCAVHYGNLISCVDGNSVQH